MKSKLLIALLLASATCFAQHPLDTIRVQRLVVDTSSNLLAPFPRPARLMPLLEVRELHNEKEGYPNWEDCFNCTWSDYHKHLWYLTRLKAPIPFGWVVLEAVILPDQVQAPKITPLEWPLESTDSAHTGLVGDSFWRKLIGRDFSLSPTTINGSFGFLQPLSWNEGIYDTAPHFIDFTSGDQPNSEDQFTWLPRRLRKRYLKYLKTHPHE